MTGKAVVGSAELVRAMFPSMRIQLVVRRAGLLRIVTLIRVTAIPCHANSAPARAIFPGEWACTGILARKRKLCSRIYGPVPR